MSVQPRSSTNAGGSSPRTQRTTCSGSTSARAPVRSSTPGTKFLDECRCEPSELIFRVVHVRRHPHELRWEIAEWHDRHFYVVLLQQDPLQRMVPTAFFPIGERPRVVGQGYRGEGTKHGFRRG